ncbi:MAG: GTP-binding protein [Leptolyngbya sp. DLM2.Bin15]|nr:MAG: GTP-binding protein [Leptolyngbya sp. DLM2.Bin15]
MSSSPIIAIAGPSGSGKTAWMSQFFADQSRPIFYFCPGLGTISVDLARVAYQFPWVQVIPEDQVTQVFSDLPDDAQVFVEIGFHLDLTSSFLASLPCHRVAILPMAFTDSEWHGWADEVIPGNDMAIADHPDLPQIWRSPLTGQVFDPPSLDTVWNEIIGGAYGQVHRAKGIFEMPDGRAFHIDFVNGLPGSEYTELMIPRWLDGRPDRFSGIEVIGWTVDHEAIAQAIVDACLPDEAIAQYQQQVRQLVEATA